MLQIIMLVLLAASFLLLLAIFLRKSADNSGDLQAKMLELEKGLLKIENALKEDFRVNRDESARIARENRTELTDSLSRTGKEQAEKLEALIVKIEEKNRELRSDIEKAFKVFADGFDKNVKSFNDLQREKFSQLDERQAKLIESTENKLEQMRATVDEKLQKTLNERLGQSFEMVGKQLESVQKGLGEMQTLATDVGGLKKVLSNVKLRGNVGEVQLAMLLEQTLAPTQYDMNVRTKAGSSDPVEFAIKLPGRSEDESSIVYLPIDAKFPKDVYEQLLNAYEHASTDEIEVATKALESTIKKMAKDIRDKYIDPPNTTDFAILFLPFESIYAEVIRRSGLVDQLRDEYKITVAGPTTLVAILNSLQMGFRTLALQKRSSEVWKVLGSVKKEFENFGGLLEKAQKNIQTGMSQLDEVVGTRTRAIQRQLRGVDALPTSDPENKILPDIIDEKVD
jgi:DNA recombination protein RmuC